MCYWEPVFGVGSENRVNVLCMFCFSFLSFSVFSLCIFSSVPFPLSRYTSIYQALSLPLSVYLRILLLIYIFPSFPPSLPPALDPAITHQHLRIIAQGHSLTPMHARTRAHKQAHGPRPSCLCVAKRGCAGAVDRPDDGAVASC